MLNALRQAIRGLRANPGRTLLTTLGIVIGIATVIVVLSAGAGFRSYINSQVEVFGTNFVTVQTQVPKTTKQRSGGFSGAASDPASLAVQITTLKNRDVESIKQLPNIIDAYGVVIGQKVASYKNVNKNAFIFGADASRFRIDKGEIAQGRPYTDLENDAAAQVALLGSDIAKDLFGNEDPIGKTIRVGSYNFEVIGVYAPRGSFGFSNDDEQVFIPIQTAQKKLLGIDYLFYLLAQMRDQNLSEATAQDITLTVRENHDITDPLKDDFMVQTQQQGLSTFNTILAGVTFLLIAVAAISLLVGGVGIMNIMYVVVTERIAEIGLKKALGATNDDILYEFLFEAILLTLGGGLIGIGLGALMSFGISRFAQSFGWTWAFSVPISGIILGLGVAGGIGVIFGVFPARRAAKLDPIEALRYE